jgi:5'-nucleotidase
MNLRAVGLVSAATLLVAAAPAQAHYGVTVNSFLADGGDGFTILRSGTDRLGGAIDLDALAAYLTAHEPTSPTPLDRITRLN